MFNTAFLKKHYFNMLLLCFVLLMVFVPSAKAFMLRGLMEIGLFKPGTSAVTAEQRLAPAVDLSGIRFKDINGKVVDLGNLKGKVVFLNFWATWCPPCLAEMPSIQKLHTQFAADPDFVFLLVDADSKLPEAQQFMQKKKYSMPVYEVASNIPEQLFKGSLPTTIVFDKKGRISFNEEGAANYGHKKFIEFMLQLKNSEQ
ncbi:TlpA family protein disulfide reductase [Pedobacter sp. SAFR-022]|uniref:TlpA family protein disulfide reductase n=1 Tax=Pedobacter sp. SAFR-022 TaxID=3436861 RepID=UPI003F7E6BE4